MALEQGVSSPQGLTILPGRPVFRTRHSINPALIATPRRHVLDLLYFGLRVYFSWPPPTSHLPPTTSSGPAVSAVLGMHSSCTAACLVSSHSPSLSPSPSHSPSYSPSPSHSHSPSPCLNPSQDVKEPSDHYQRAESTATQKFAIYGFIPLASIAASPVCTAVVPPSLALSPSLDFTSSSARPHISNPCLPASSHPLSSSFPPHSTPLSASSVQALTRSSSSTAPSHRPSAPFSTSASFPASMPPHVYTKPDIGLKRGVSVPDMSPQSQISSKPFPSCKRARTSDGPVVAPLQTANLSSFPILHQSPETFATHQHLSPPSPVNRTIPSPGDIHFPEKTKDAIRKYHALKELLATEVGYLIDLRIFVTIYLRNLSTLTSRSPTSSTFRSSMSFTAGPWMNSYTHLQAAAVLPSETSGTQLFGSAPLKDTIKPTRSLLSDTEIETLSRNAEDILQFHEEFVNELRDGVASLGFSMNYDENKENSTPVDEYQQQGIENIESAIRIVSAIFISKAFHFKRYEPFCAAHPEALELVKKTLHHHGAAWEAYGQRCSVLVASLLLASGAAVAPSGSPQNPLPDPMPNTIQTSNTSARRRAISLTSSDATIRPLRRRISGALSKDVLAFPADPRRERPARRIEFMDYMIKPVQRICRYPLLLDQLKPSKTVLLGPQRRFEALSDVDELVEKAAQAMRDVATSVDEARHKQDIATRSSLIVSRIYLSGSLMTSPSRNPTLQNLTLDFFSSLGNCLFAGSLDVLHHHPLVSLEAFSTVTAKYLGAFLYPGGYIILAKVSKGKKYEPKHWFSLVGFELADVDDDEAMLAFSFRLSSEDQVYELGAGCRREKDAWMTAIREASSQTTIWINEPTPSFMFDGKGEYIAAITDSELKPSSETANNTDNEGSENITIRRRRTRMKMKPWRCDTVSRGERPLTSGSVKAMFTPINADEEDIELRRPATTARSQVDQDLQDVLSQMCLNARSYAFSREEELFPPPVSTRVPLPRSNSSMSISGMAKTRLTRYDSVRIPKRKGTIEGSDMQSSPTKFTTLGSRRKSKQLSINSLPMTECRASPVESYPTPPSSQASSTAPSFVISYETVKSTYLTSGNSAPTSSLALTRRGSLVQNVRQFLTSVSPMTALSSVKHTIAGSESRSNSRNQHPSHITKKSVRTARRGHV